MKKISRLIENVGLGLFINGSCSIMTDGLSLNNILVTAVSFYAMAVVIIFAED